MECDDSAEKTAQVHNEQLVVGTRGEALCCHGVAEVREEIERVLQVVYDLMVHGHGA